MQTKSVFYKIHEIIVIKLPFICDRVFGAMAQYPMASDLRLI